jgi:hypothetical protein
MEPVEVDAESGAFLAGRDEEIADGGKDGDATLQGSRQSKMLQDPFPLSKRDVTVLGPVVQALVRTVLHAGHDLLLCRAAGAEPVGDHALGLQALLLQQAGEKPLGGLGIAAGLDDFVEHIAILIDRPPQPVLPAGDRYHDLVEMPDIVRPGRLSPKALRIVRAELPRLAPDRFVEDEDAPLEQHLLDQPQAQRKAEPKVRAKQRITARPHGRWSRAGSGGACS